MPHPPFIVLDENSRVPIYRQIYETVRRAILSGEFFPGKLLPPTRFLAKQLNISRMTVINGYDQLTAEGYIESKKGGGTFVALHLPEDFLQTLPVGKGTGKNTFSDRKNKFSRYGEMIFNESADVLENNRATPIIPFQHGLAAVDKFPFDVWNKLMTKACQTLSVGNFSYGDAAGFYPLREAIAAHLKSVRAVNCVPEQVIITCGAQQAFDLIGRIFLEKKSEVFIEDPCYPGAKQAFEIFGAKLVPVPVDDYGFNLEAGIKSSSKARLAYLTPSHQFPLGATMPLDRRLQILEWAQRQNAWIIEDDYDSEFRYEGRPLPSLQGLDAYNRVLYVGTFSKTVFPALKLGCLVVPPDLVEIFTAARVLSGAVSPVMEQATLAEFIVEGHFTRHLRRMRRMYESRKEILTFEIKKHLADKLSVQETNSGMHIIGWLSEKINDQKIVAEAARKKIKLSAVSAHFLTESKKHGLIFGYAAFDEKQIKNGIKKLKTLFDDL